MRDQVIPKNVDPLSVPRDLVFLQRLANALDEAVAVPGTKLRVGLDPLIGLVPGLGDVVGACIGVALVLGALRHRVPARHVATMTGRILVDTLLGGIPLLGDLFDAAYHGNTRNAQLILQYRDRSRLPRTPEETLRAGGVLLLVFLVVLLFALIGAIALFAFIIRWVAAAV